MNEWKPDEAFITRLENYWSACGDLDSPNPSSLGQASVRDLVDLYRKENGPVSDELADYLERNFDADKPVCDHVYTMKETADAMRKGEPFGIFIYSLCDPSVALD